MEEIDKIDKCYFDGNAKCSVMCARAAGNNNNTISTRAAVLWRAQQQHLSSPTASSRPRRKGTKLPTSLRT